MFTRTNTSRPNINLTALMDVAFILVIFIVLAANFHRIKDITVDLPEAAGQEADPKSLVITVPVSGPLDIQGTKVPIKGLTGFLKTKSEKFSKVLLLTDKKSSINRAVKVLSQAQAAGFQSVGIATQGK